MKLLINEPFSLEIPLADGGEDIVTGTYKEFSPAIKKIIQDTFKEESDKAKAGAKKSKKFQKLYSRLERWEADTTKSNDDIDKLQDEVFELEEEINQLSEEINEAKTEEKTYIKRIELQFNQEIHEKIKNLCKHVGYVKLFDTVAEDINEKKGNAIKS